MESDEEMSLRRRQRSHRDFSQHDQVNIPNVYIYLLASCNTRIRMYKCVENMHQLSRVLYVEFNTHAIYFNLYLHITSFIQPKRKVTSQPIFAKI